MKNTIKLIQRLCLCERRTGVEARVLLYGENVTLRTSKSRVPVRQLQQRSSMDFLRRKFRAVKTLRMMSFKSAPLCTLLRRTCSKTPPFSFWLWKINIQVTGLSNWLRVTAGIHPSLSATSTKESLPAFRFSSSSQKERYWFFDPRP